MKEQSHKDEMAAALRADFARLRARGGDGVPVARPAGPLVPDEPGQVASDEQAEPVGWSSGLSRFLRRG